MNLLKFTKTFLIAASILASHGMEKNNETPLPKEIALCKPIWTMILDNMDEKTFLQTRQTCKFFYNLSQKFFSLDNKSNQPENIDSWLESSKLKFCLNLENTHNVTFFDIAKIASKCPNLQVLKLGKVDMYSLDPSLDIGTHSLSKLKMVDLENLEILDSHSATACSGISLFNSLLKPCKSKKITLPFRYFLESMLSLTWLAENLNMNPENTFENVTITFTENEAYLKTQVKFVQMTMNGKTIYAKKPSPLNKVIISDNLAKLYFNDGFDEYGSPKERRDTIVKFLLAIPEGKPQPEFIYNGLKD